MKRFWNKKIVWSQTKNELLKRTRDISFEDILISISSKLFIKIEEKHFNKKFPHQKILYVEYNNYIYIVPFDEKKEEIFLITIYPSYKKTIELLRKGAK